MAGALAYHIGMASGAGMYVTGKFLWGALETYGRHKEISNKEELDEEDKKFLEESMKSVNEYLNWGKSGYTKKILGKPEEVGENWGHIIAANETDVHDGEFQYQVPGIGYEDEEVRELLESQEN